LTEEELSRALRSIRLCRGHGYIVRQTAVWWWTISSAI